MVLPFLVAVFWYDERRVAAVVLSMIAGITATVVWRFLLGSPWDVGPALAGFLCATCTFLAALPFSSRVRLRGVLQPIPKNGPE